MTLYLCLVAASAFTLGVGVGWLLRGLCAETGHTRTMTPRSNRRHRLGENVRIVLGIISLRWVAILLVITAMLFSAMTGFLQIRNGARDHDRDVLERARVECNRIYNKLNGLARDERVTVQARGTQAELVWLRSLRDGVRTKTLSADSLDSDLTAYIESLDAVQTSQLENPYPAPDLCDDGYATKDELKGFPGAVKEAQK